MSVGPVIEARRALSAALWAPVAEQSTVAYPQPNVVSDDVAFAMPRQWPWALASLLLMLVIVAACARAALHG
jgi:hypothetical protein